MKKGEPRKPRTKSLSAIERKSIEQSARALCSLDIYTGMASPNLQTLATHNAPREISDAMTQCAEWHKKNWFVRTVVERKLDFFNYGFQIVTEKSNQKQLQSVLDVAGGQIAAYVESVWRDRIIYDNVISFWLDNGITVTPPMTLAPEQCDYRDVMGREILKYSPGYKPSDLPQDIKTRWSKQVTLSEEEGEFFRVLKRARLGHGFGWPAMFTIHQALSQSEGMEVGESILGFLCRSPIRQHVLGHEIKQGQRAGHNAWFWNKDRGAAVEKMFKGKVGLLEVTTNFDHKIQIVYVDPALFDGAKWDTVTRRLAWWAGAVGFMMLSSQQPSTFLMPIFKEEAIAERQRIGRHLEAVLKEVYAIKFPFQVKWSNRCFNDPRVSLELLKTGLTAGPLSQTTFLEESGFNPAEEKDNKSQEAKDPPEQHLPIYDKDHGQKPGKEPPGRKPGTSDPSV